MSISLYFRITKKLLLFALIIIVGCSGDQKQQMKEPELTDLNQKPVETIKFGQFLSDTTHVNTPPEFYDSWENVYYDNIKLIYPDYHPLKNKMQEFAQVFKTIIRRNSEIFRLPEPTDSIVIFYYTGFGQGQELSNSEFPTVRGDTIYYWTGIKLGIPVAKLVLNRWTKVKSQFEFLNQGILRLMDASGRDYHSMTLDFIDSSKFLTFDSLLADEHINVYAEAYQTAEAASFIDYFIFKYGIDNFKLLYESKVSFNDAVQTICNMNSKALENDWISVIRQAVRNRKTN